MDKPQVVKDIWNAILDDDWMWIATWGKNRKGKSTLQLQLAYAVYRDWDKVLSSVVWNISGLLYNLKEGKPETITTLNGYHNRVPLILLDDFGATSNKAKTQHDSAFDTFKGAFDTYGTKLAVLIASCLTPDEPTFQLYQKYTHELYVYERGKAKYDSVSWSQDYKGWRNRQKKTWIQNFTFNKVPDDIYRQYDQMRLSIVDELNIQITDQLAANQTTMILKRLQPDDVALMQLIRERGQVSYYHLHTDLEDKFEDALVRCKARQLIVPVRKSTVYWYDLTTLGYDVLLAYEKQENAKKAKETQENQAITH